MKKLIGLVLSVIITTSILVFLSCTKQHNTNWSTYGGSVENIHYSSLNKIDTDNVGKLQVAWTYHTGDADTVNHSQIQCNPLIINGVLYGATPKMKLFAIDAANGKEFWHFNPFDTTVMNKHFNFGLNNCRGISYWTDNQKDQRLFYVAGPNLYCVNAKTGKLVASFGQEGKIDLHNGLDRNVSDLFISSTSPGLVYKNIIVMGSRVDEGAAAAPGHIRAFDVRSGRQVWIFHTIPHPDEYGYNTWKDPEAYKHIGGANAWSGFSLDIKRGIIFTSTGSASFDFYGGKRLGDNLFADCVLALDARTGKRLWHFQDVHHDLWDHDISSPPCLVTINKDGKLIDAVAVTTKTGFIFIFDRVTGKPVYPIVERSVPHNSELTGEKLSPTQPYVDVPKPFVRQSITEKDLNEMLPSASLAKLKKVFARYRKGSLFEPPSKEGTIVMPGFDGGAEWGGPSYDPKTGILYINANEMANVLTMVDLKTNNSAKETYKEAGARLFKANCMACHGSDMKGSGNYPSLLGVNKKYNEQQFFQLITNGRRMMPSFKQLDSLDRKAIASFILNLKTNSTIRSVIHSSEGNYRNLPYTLTGYNLFLSSEGLPGISPPWGTLSAINLNTGAYAWKIPLGDYPYYERKGIHTGSENYGGSVVTAGGLLIIAATRDGNLRIFNKLTGKLLNTIKLPASAFATPCVYELNGTEYIAIACGGGKLGTKSSDVYIAYALPGSYLF